MKYCCEKCFSDYFIVKMIQSLGEEGNCGYCSNKNVFCIDTQELAEFFSPFLNLYTAVDDFMPLEELKTYQGLRIWEIIQEDWEPFSEYTKQEELLRDIAQGTGIDPDDNILFSTFVRNMDEYWGDDREDEDSVAIWQTFTEELKWKNRYFTSEVVDLDQLEHLLQFIGREFKYSENRILYRARHSEKNKVYQPNEIGKPPQDRATNGRANPNGIPCLYLASDEMTAIAEIRPYKNDYVTVGRFTITRNLSLIDLREISPFQFATDEDFVDSIKQIVLLNTLGADLKKPINPRAGALEYLPTQYLCEFIKSKEWDGVIYKSSLGSGYNVAIFNDEKLKCEKTGLFNVTNAEYDYEEVN